MMNTLKIVLVAGFLVLSIGAGSNIAVAAVGMEQPINNTIAHLDEAIKSVNANELETAQEHIKAAGQSSKSIIGGSVEAKARSGSRAIKKARRQLKEGNTAEAANFLNQAREIFKSLLQPVAAGGRGGLK